MSKRTPYYFFLPALLFLGLFVFLPFLQVIYFSFLNYNIFEGSSFVGFSNYSKLFSDTKFLYALLNSLIFLLVTPVLIVISLMLALVLRDTTKVTRFFRSLYFLPVITPIVIAGIFWKWIFAEDTGILNYWLSLVHISSISWLTKYPVNLLSVMIVTIWRGFGYYMLIFIAGLTAIPKEVEEAARLDGATKFQQAVYVIMPMLKPVILLVLVMSSSAAIKMFTELYILIPGTPLANKTLVFYMFKYAFERFDFGYGSAAGVIIFILTFGFSVMNIKLLGGDNENS